MSVLLQLAFLILVHFSDFYSYLPVDFPLNDLLTYILSLFFYCSRLSLSYFIFAAFLCTCHILIPQQVLNDANTFSGLLTVNFSYDVICEQMFSILMYINPEELAFFSFNTLNVSLHLLFACMISEENSAVILIFVPGVFDSLDQPHRACQFIIYRLCSYWNWLQWQAFASGKLGFSVFVCPSCLEAAGCGMNFISDGSKNC